MWAPGLSRGKESFFLKFLYTSQFEHAAKSNGVMSVALIEATLIVALMECDKIGGLAKEIDLLKDRLSTNCQASWADSYQGNQKSPSKNHD